MTRPRVANITVGLVLRGFGSCDEDAAFRAGRPPGVSLVGVIHGHSHGYHQGELSIFPESACKACPWGVAVPRFSCEHIVNLPLTVDAFQRLKLDGDDGLPSAAAPA